MEIRPLKSSLNDAKLIAINFQDETIGVSNGEFFLMWYSKAFIAYKYELDSETGAIEVAKVDAEYMENGTLHSLELLANSQLKLELTKQVFDFTEQAWVATELLVIYQKVE